MQRTEEIGWVNEKDKISIKQIPVQFQDCVITNDEWVNALFREIKEKMICSKCNKEFDESPYQIHMSSDHDGRFNQNYHFCSLICWSRWITDKEPKREDSATPHTPEGL
jgi:hypothetical protein